MYTVLVYIIPSYSVHHIVATHYLRCVHCFCEYYPLPSVHYIVATHYLRCVHCFSEYYPLPSVHNIVAIYCTHYLRCVHCFSIISLQSFLSRSRSTSSA